MCQAASCSCSRGSAPSAALGRLEDGAPAPHEHLRRGWLDTLPRRDWRGLDKNGFALTLAGECPLCGAGRLEDGAPAPRECLRPE